MFPIPKAKVLANKRATYSRLVCDMQSHKAETHRVRITAGGNLIIYNGTTSTPATATPTIKTHWNSVASNPNAKYLTLDVKDFYLNSKLEEFECMHLPYNLFPKDLIELCGLDKLVAEDSYVH